MTKKEKNVMQQTYIRVMLHFLFMCITSTVLLVHSGALALEGNIVSASIIGALAITSYINPIYIAHVAVEALDYVPQKQEKQELKVPKAGEYWTVSGLAAHKKLVKILSVNTALQSFTCKTVLGDEYSWVSWDKLVEKKYTEGE